MSLHRELSSSKYTPAIGHLRVGQRAGVLARVGATEGEHAVRVGTRAASDGCERDAELLGGDETLRVRILDDGRDARVLVGRQRAAGEVFGTEAARKVRAKRIGRKSAIRTQ